MNILYATDGSPASLAGAQFLGQLGLDTDCQVTVLTVAPPHEEAEAQAALTAALAALSHCTTAITTTVRRGHPAEMILSFAEANPTDLIVVGWRGRSAITRFFLGSVAERVALHAPCPVLLARPLRGSLRRILVGVDGSDHSVRAVEWLQGFPLPEECEVKLLMVLPFLEDVIRARMLIPPHHTDYAQAQVDAERQEQEAKEQLDRLAQSLGTSRLQATGEIRRGEPALGLIEAAEEWRADLVVVGSQGLSAVERFVMGSVSENVLRHAPCSVLVVRAVKGEEL
jgi:nucleotide-binding universal stress UspA family protein